MNVLQQSAKHLTEDSIGHYEYTRRQFGQSLPKPFSQAFTLDIRHIKLEGTAHPTAPDYDDPWLTRRRALPFLGTVEGGVATEPVESNVGNTSASGIAGNLKPSTAACAMPMNRPVGAFIEANFPRSLLKVPIFDITS